jgi:hypothetical protein
MEEAIQGCVRDLVFNLDEVGVSEWEDPKSKKAVIAIGRDSQIIHYGLSRNLKHIIFITCVAASGEHVIPDTITSQDSIHSQESDDVVKAPKKKGIE